MKFDPAIVKKDRAQGVFAQDFLQFSDRMASGYRLSQGKANIAKLKNTFARIEKRFGVPAPVLAAFWGLETDFGAFNGDGPTLTSLATLGYDCRRPDLFRRQLLSAIKVIDRGDLTAAEMRGPWAGEVGQVQFLMERYLAYGVDFDGDGKVNMLKSSADALASAANYLQAIGWQAGQPWLEEVRVPDKMPWEQADLTIKLPLSQWAKWGVTYPGGKPLSPNKPDASLLLPMGRDGPAFLAYPNFDVYLEWNNSLVYSTTAAYLATRIAGAPPVGRGSGVDLPTVARDQGDPAAARRQGLRRRQGRWHRRREHARRGQGGAVEVRAAGGLLSVAGTARQTSRRVGLGLHAHVAAGRILDALADRPRLHALVVLGLDPLLPVRPP